MSEASDRNLQRGIQSIEVGGQLLRALVHNGRPMALKDLARDADMTPAKAHPYMVSFGRLGLAQANPVQRGSLLLDGLAQRTGHTVAIAVWGDRGATIVRIAESPAAVHVNMRHGTVFSLTNTASGRLFAAYLAPEAVRGLF